MCVFCVNSVVLSFLLFMLYLILTVGVGCFACSCVCGYSLRLFSGLLVRVMFGWLLFV